MAKKNNKGFSLVEIVIAIAILTLLLTPIVRQLTQTLRVNRLAKEAQYANENAVYELEYFQKADLNELATVYGPPVENTVTCKLYKKTMNASGAITGLTQIGTVDYTTWTYTLSNVELGSRNTEYKRTVVLDDLSNKVRAYGGAGGTNWTISYDNTDGYGSFEVTDDGSLVEYASGAVVSVVCDSAEYVADPNEVNLGNVQDLDHTKVAIINGDASAFDSQVESALYSVAMDKLKVIDYASWEQALFHSTNDSLFNQGYNDTIKKLTKIYVDKFSDSNGDYYLVKVDVYYDYYFKITINGNAIEDKNVLKYNVFSQKFYTDRCPDIYFEYQPYTLESAGSSVIYAADDYIMFDNYVKDAKLYLYKPYYDQMNQGLGVNESSYVRTNDNVYYTDSTKSNKVSIHLCNANSSVENMKVYTNLDTNIYTGSAKSQFVCDEISGLFTDVNTDKSGQSIVRVPYERDYDSDGDGILEAYLNPLSEDTRTDNRLYTVTVTVGPVSDNAYNTICLTGAKGEN